jgi:hypothetical protein
MARQTMTCEVTPEFKAKMALAEQKIKEQVIGDLNHYAVQLASNLRAGAPKDTNALRAGIHPEFATAENPVVKIVSNANYTTWVNEGTKPHFPPVAALIGWSRRHKWPGVVDKPASRRAFKEKQEKYKIEHPLGSKKKHYAATKSKTTHSKGKATAKGETKEMTVEAQAFLIARAISKRGGRKQNFIEPVMKPAKAEIIKICQSSLSKVNL